MPDSLDLRRHRRFGVDEASAALYRDGLLLKLGLGKRNRARAAVDLSEGGIRLVAAEPLLPGTRVRIRIEMEKYQDVIEAPAVIRWCGQLPEKPGEFLIGAMFAGLSPAQLRKIALMREFLTSIQYKVMRETRRHQKKAGLTPPK
jgi:hypothetical protein